MDEHVTACHHVERDKLFYVISREPHISTSEFITPQAHIYTFSH